MIVVSNCGRPSGRCSGWLAGSRCLSSRGFGRAIAEPAQLLDPLGWWSFGTYLNDSCGGSSQFTTCVTVNLADAQARQVLEDYQTLGFADAAGNLTPAILFAGFRRLSAPNGVADDLANQRIGNAAADSIAARFHGSAREVSLQAASGRRVVDVLTDTGLAIESKVGRTSLTTATRRQIGRDVELMTDLSSPVSSVRWEFFTSPVTGRGGPTGPLAQALNDAGIPFVVNP